MPKPLKVYHSDATGIDITRDKKQRDIGYSEQEHKHERITSGNKQRYVFYGRKLDDLNKPEVLQKVLKAFLSLTAEQAEAIVKRDFGKIPKELIEIFHRTKFVNLVALSILFQGYLAVHSDTSLNRELTAYLQDVSGKIKKTEDVEWWKQSFTNETEDTLTEKIIAEWQSEQLPTKLSDLIKAIFGNKSITDVKMVEAAYEVIATRLTSI